MKIWRTLRHCLSSFCHHLERVWIKASDVMCFSLSHYVIFISSMPLFQTSTVPDILCGSSHFVTAYVACYNPAHLHGSSPRLPLAILTILFFLFLFLILLPLVINGNVKMRYFGGRLYWTIKDWCISDNRRTLRQPFIFICDTSGNNDTWFHMFSSEGEFTCLNWFNSRVYVREFTNSCPPMFSVRIICMVASWFSRTCHNAVATLILLGSKSVWPSFT